jgi:hypothetical protein
MNNIFATNISPQVSISIWYDMLRYRTCLWIIHSANHRLLGPSNTNTITMPKAHKTNQPGATSKRLSYVPWNMVLVRDDNGCPRMRVSHYPNPHPKSLPELELKPKEYSGDKITPTPVGFGFFHPNPNP